LASMCENTSSGAVLFLHHGVTVNANDLAVDPAAVLGGKEGNDAGNIEGLANAVERRPGGGVLVDLIVAELVTIGNVLLANCVVHVGLDATRSNAVDSDLLVTAV
jgi:hypothetical protein